MTITVLRVPASDDPHAYWQAIHDAWAAGQPFAVIEPDVQAGDDVLARFESCPEPWCFHSYPVPADAHAYEPVDPHCKTCEALEHDHPSVGPAALDHPFAAGDLSCRACGRPEHAPIVAVQIADLGGTALGCSRFRPADLPAAFDHEMLASPVHWANMDVHLHTVLHRHHQVAAHRHMPNVDHTKAAQ